MNTGIEFTAGDRRRAAALAAHCAVADAEGIQAIWAEAAEADCWPDLTAAVIALLFDLIPELRSAGGVAMLRMIARDAAAWEQRDDE